MKRILLLTLVALIAVSLPLAVLAADITGARYKGRVVVENTGATATSVATVATIDTDAFITLGYFNTAVDNMTIRNESSVDVPFMPGYDGNPWCMWVPSIGENKYLPFMLYTADVTGGLLSYFPGSTGMSVDDADIDELGDNFRIALEDVYLDTSVADVIASKPDAIEWTTDGAGNVSFTFLDTSSSTGWVGAVGHEDEAAKWSNETLAYDGDTGTRANETAYAPSGEWPSYYLVLNFNPTFADSIRLWTLYNANNQDVDVDAYYDGNWHDVYQGSTVNAKWKEVDIGSVELVSAVRFRQFVVSGAPKQYLYELEINKYDSYSVSAAIPSGHYDTLELIADGTDLDLDVDGVTVDTVALAGASVPDNAAAWQFGSNATLYIGAVEVDVSGTPEARWEWEYGDTFTDSINSIVATPTFRTTSSNADVSAELTTFGPVAEAKAPPYALSEQVDQIQITPDMSGNFNTDEGTGTFPLAGVIAALAAANDTPAQLPLTIIAGFVIVGLSLSSSAIMRRFGSGGLIVKTIIIVALMGIFVALGNFAIDFWMVVVFMIMAVSIMFASKQLGW